MKLHFSRPLSLLMIVAASGLVAGCGVSSITKGFTGKWFGGAEQTTTATLQKPQLEQKLAASTANGDVTNAIQNAGAGHDCPKFAVWPNDKMLTKYEDGQVGNGLAVNYRGEITKTARECAYGPNKIVVKYGFSGRLLLGPKGQTGAHHLPMYLHVSDRTGNKLYTEKINANVSVPEGQKIGYFSIVKSVNVPVPEGFRGQDFKLFIGFEDTAAASAS